MAEKNSICKSLLRLVLERGYRKKSGMSGRHIEVSTWLDALGLQAYLPLFSGYGGVEDLLYASEAEIRELGLKNGAHRAKVVSSLRILREKYEKGKTTGSGVFSLQQPRSPTSPTTSLAFPDFPAVIVSPEKLQQDLQKELSADPSELKSRPWYHGSISRQRAEFLITNCGDFLLRDCISKPGDFVLTCCCRGMPLHFMVNAQVGECAPGSLPTISYHFEEESFSSIQELIHFYLARQKPVTVASNAVLKNPVARSMPLSYYDSKYGTLHSLDSCGYYTPSQSPKASPFVTPSASPKASPTMNRRTPKRTGSQPLLSLDDSEMDRSRSPSLERFVSLPVINIIPPGGPGYTGGFRQPQCDSNPVVSHQRAGSAPVLMEDADRNAAFPSSSLTKVPAGSESNLSRAPPPKPSRVPSIKYKQRPVVAVRNQQLYVDDGRDYTDFNQLSGPPSWAENQLQQVTLEPQFPHLAKSHSFQGSRDDRIVDNNFNNIEKGYQTLPLNPKIGKQHGRFRLGSNTNYTIFGNSCSTATRTNIVDNYNNDVSYLASRNVTMPGFNLGSKINLDAFSSSLFESAENRLLEQSAVSKVKSLILTSSARALAGHITKVDLELLRVVQEDDFGVRVTSGIELCTLPQGEQLREDIIERCECQRLFVMATLMKCETMTERARMLSHWIQTAEELRANMGNLYAFTSVMEAITAPQVKNLRDTWLILRQKHTSSAYLFDTKLKSLLKLLSEGNGILPLQNVTLPNLTPVVQLLQRDIDDVNNLLTWESSDPNYGLDFLLSHMDIARIVASQTSMYRRAANALLQELKVDSELEQLCRTEFQMRLMWGSKGARAVRWERVKKFEQLLAVLSERLEPPGDDGTEV